MRGLSLRARLILGVIALAAIGLVAADIATYSSLRSFLLDRTDSALEAAHPAFEGQIFGNRGQQGPGQPGVDYAQVRLLDNTIVVPLHPTFDFTETETPSPPILPAKIALPTHRTPDGDRVEYFTVSSKDGDNRYRVRVSIEPRESHDLLILAASLNGVDSTVHRLLFIELLVTAAALIGIALLGLWVVRLSLRPLEAIGAT